MLAHIINGRRPIEVLAGIKITNTKDNKANETNCGPERLFDCEGL